HAPIGMKGEIKKTLQELKTQSDSPSLVLGLRDILDEPEKVCAAWEMEGVYPVLDEVYDRIFIYGTPAFFDPISAYRFGQKAKRKTSFTGFISDGDLTAFPMEGKKNIPNPKKVLLTIGGGEDGAEIVSAYLEMLSKYECRLPIESSIILGPFMPESRKRAFEEKAKGLTVRFEEFLPELLAQLQEADLVVSMGGYNTVVEILSSAKRALIIPRIYPRKEQLLRARRLSEMGLVGYISPEELTPGRLFETVHSMIADPTSPLAEARQKNLLPLDGAFKLAQLCRPLLATQGVLK
ncbi:MAG: glycosyltransferase family protein, partial [Limisphaerales bacterium]